jgi:hypothetical protein
MRNQVLANYLIHLVPAVLIPAFVYIFDPAVPPPNLLKLGLVFPLLVLAMRGLSWFFPKENLAHRPMGRMVEYAVLQGLVFAAFMLFLVDFAAPEPQSDLSDMLWQFAITAVVMAAANFGIAFYERRKLNAPGG